MVVSPPAKTNVTDGASDVGAFTDRAKVVWACLGRSGPAIVVCAAHAVQRRMWRILVIILSLLPCYFIAAKMIQ